MKDDPPMAAITPKATIQFKQTVQWQYIVVQQQMKVKTYGLFEEDKQVVLVYANASQKEFLDYELKASLKRLRRSERIEFENTANGVWYSRQHPVRGELTQTVLISKESSSISLASSFLNNAAEIEKKFNIKTERDKLRSKIEDLVRLYNASSKMENLSNNVMELEGIVKGNLNKMVNNMTELDSAQRKSEMMAEMSMQFERDSQTLEQKMRKRKCMMRAMIGGMILLVLVIAWWIFVL